MIDWLIKLKALKPKFEKVATYMPIDNPKLNFFVIDGTKNEVVGSVVSGYPTLYFYPRGDKMNPVPRGWWMSWR